MKLFAVTLMALFALSFAAGPDYKYQDFYPGWKELKRANKEHNTEFYNKLGEMAATKQNGIETLYDSNGKVVLYYTVHESGKGDTSPKAGTTCDCHYKGVTVDGNQFDSSFDRGSSSAFAPNQVIKGWTQAMQQMVEGDMWEMYIPHNNAYGPRGRGGNIPGGACLIFIMRMEKIKGQTQARIVHKEL